jgi:hypothetical protein
VFAELEKPPSINLWHAFGSHPPKSLFQIFIASLFLLLLLLVVPMLLFFLVRNEGFFFLRVWCSLALVFRFGFLQRIEVQEALVFFEDFSSSSGYVVSVDFCVGMGILG